MSRRIKRREFVVLLGGAAAAWPLAARAQQAAMPVIGYFSARSPDTEAPLREPFLRALEKLGFAAGRNIAIEYRFAEGQEARLPALAAELVGRRVAMLVATDRPSAIGRKSGDRDNSNRVRQRIRPCPVWPGRQLQPAGRQRHRCEPLDHRAWTETLGALA
jgi:hypothetical protein